MVPGRTARFARVLALSMALSGGVTPPAFSDAGPPSLASPAACIATQSAYVCSTVSRTGDCLSPVAVSVCSTYEHLHNIEIESTLSIPVWEEDDTTTAGVVLTLHIIAFIFGLVSGVLVRGIRALGRLTG